MSHFTKDRANISPSHGSISCSFFYLGEGSLGGLWRAMGKGHPLPHPVPPPAPLDTNQPHNKLPSPSHWGWENRETPRLRFLSKRGWPGLNLRAQIIQTQPPFHSPTQHLESVNYSKGVIAWLEIGVPNGRAELVKGKNWAELGKGKVFINGSWVGC